MKSPKTYKELCRCTHPLDAHDLDQRCIRCPEVDPSLECTKYVRFPLGLWRHYKGNIYNVTGLRRTSEHLTTVLVDYTSMKGEAWSRPLFTPAWDDDRDAYGWLDLATVHSVERFVPLPPVTDKDIADVETLRNWLIEVKDGAMPLSSPDKLLENLNRFAGKLP